VSIRKKKYHDYPERTCLSLHDCALCNKPIKLGERYYDGGFGRRVHKDCLILIEKQTEVRL